MQIPPTVSAIIGSAFVMHKFPLSLSLLKRSMREQRNCAALEFCHKKRRHSNVLKAKSKNSLASLLFLSFFSLLYGVRLVMIIMLQHFLCVRTRGEEKEIIFHRLIIIY